jgi:endonuclease/exonuclease/phosphatase (EEP) superfamily protein YafD
MQHLRWGLALWLSCLTLQAAAQQSPESPYQAYREAAGAVLQTYLKAQQAWNHHFIAIAPKQRSSEQIASQETYRRFLADTLAQWRQLPVVAACQSTHLLYELALYSYSMAADFRLSFLYARSALFGLPKAATLAEERSRYYTSQGDAYFKQAALLAQTSGCVALTTPE